MNAPVDPSQTPHSPSSPAAGPRSARPLPSAKFQQSTYDTEPLHDNQKERRGFRPLVALALALLAGILVGAPLVFLQRPQYRCVSTLAIAGEPSTQQLERYRFELLDHAREQFAGTDELGATSRRWFVDALGDRQLRLGVDFSDPQRGVSRVQQVAESYIQRMAAHAEGAVATRTEAEVILDERATALRTQRDMAATQSKTAQAALPPQDPTDEYLALIDGWNSLESHFATTREGLEAAKTRVQELETAPKPQNAVVSKEDRDRAIAEDEALTQDLKELRVNLTELKLHLLNVWQKSAGPLEPLMLAVEDMIDFITPDRLKSIADADRLLLEQVLTDAKDYQTVLAIFEQTWHREFTSLRLIEPDPRNDSVYNVFQTVRGSLRDFLFDGSKRLALLRTNVRKFSLGSADSARYHVLRSNVTRAFQAVQAAHHRFEFAAGTIETPENFRLDAALLGTRGLRRRSRARINLIEARLQSIAIEKAREKQLKDLAEARRTLEARRNDNDAVVAKLITLQDGINMNANKMAAYHQAAKSAEVASTRWSAINDEVTAIEAQLAKLQKQREAQASASHVKIVSCKSLGSSANLNERIRMGAIGACLTFLVVFMGQWLVGRRR